MEWQPIETAPKAGEFLVFIPSEQWMQVHSARRYPNGAMVVSGDADEDGEVTHWMHLPPPPATAPEHLPPPSAPSSGEGR